MDSGMLSAVFGTVLAAAGIIMILSRWVERSRCTEKTVGTVTAIKEKKLNEALTGNAAGTYVCTALVTYTVEGQDRQFMTRKQRHRGYYSWDQEVEVFYNPANPAQIYSPEKGVTLTKLFLASALGILILLASFL